MKRFIFLVVNLAVSSVFFVKSNGQIVDIGEEKDITEANKDLIDDILELTDIQRSAILGENRRWQFPIPYVLEKSLGKYHFSCLINSPEYLKVLGSNIACVAKMNAKGVILRALDRFRLKSCIDFKPRDSEDQYISLQLLGGCFSYIGRTTINKQTLSIGRYCDTIAIVEHEFIHALGFYHEQSRYDRDNHVTIAVENIISGREHNFDKKSKDITTTQGVAYDYMSVMHYGKNAFSNGNGSTIITKDPAFQDVIGQRLEMSPSDVLELNRLYKCNSSVAFKMYCGFSKGNMCEMTRCSTSDNAWTMVKSAPGGPITDHTSLPSGNNDQSKDDAYFMHGSTASGQEGDSAWLETKRMRPSRECHIQCLQFYYYHSGHESDQLNIWIREFQHEWDTRGSLRLMGQITGSWTNYWQIQHVSLNATKDFQVVFEVRKGSKTSKGGFSIDDISLSETECPHVTMQINNLEQLLNTSSYGTTILSPRQYSRAGYAYAVGAVLYRSYVGLFVQLLSGKYDEQLEWPVPQRQVTFQMLDQNPDIKQQMSKQSSITSDRSVSGSDNKFRWGNPREVGTPQVNENNETVYVGPMLGRRFFARLEQIKTRDFLKGGNAIFLFDFQDLTPLVNGSALPCPQMRPPNITLPPKALDNGPCSQIGTTTHRPSNTYPPPTTHHPPPRTTDDNSIFGFSPATVASPVLTLLLALMLLIR